MSKFGKIFVEMGGELIDITDLKKEDYEDFLKRIKALDFVYNITKSPRRSKQ